MPDIELRSRHGKSLKYMFTKVPFVVALELALVEWESEEGMAVVRLPATDLADNGSGTPHGGAIATLLDTTGAAAVWNGHDYEQGVRGSTTSLSVNYVGSARDEAILATGRCVRRAKELNFVTVQAVGEKTGRPVASAVMTYRIA